MIKSDGLSKKAKQFIIWNFNITKDRGKDRLHFLGMWRGWQVDCVRFHDVDMLRGPAHTCEIIENLPKFVILLFRVTKLGRE